jgi:hypothetical protein
LQVPQAFLHRTVENLKEYVQGCTTELVFNIDEVGISDWEDCKTRNIMVPDHARRGDRSLNISRSQTYFGDCSCLCDWKITHPVDNHVAGFSSGSRAAQVERCCVRNGFGPEIESEAINQHRNLRDQIRTASLPNLAELHALDEFAEEAAVLLTDNWSSHKTCDMIGFLTEGGVRVITLHYTQLRLFKPLM